MFIASPLMLAAYAGEPGNVSLLHAKGGDVNRKMLLIGAFPASAMATAVSFGGVDMIKALIAAGADMKEHDPDGMSLLHMAVLTNHPEAAQALRLPA
jgi:ankyrin repeat protein